MPATSDFSCLTLRFGAYCRIPLQGFMSFQGNVAMAAGGVSCLVRQRSGWWLRVASTSAELVVAAGCMVVSSRPP